MINFEKLVESVLLAEALIKDSTAVSPFSEVYSTIVGTFNVPALPTDEAFYSKIQNSIFTRGTEYALAEDEMILQYPYIDFICYVNEQWKAGPTPKTDNFKLNVDDFTAIADLNKYKTTWITHFDNIKRNLDTLKPDKANRHTVIDYLPFSTNLKEKRPKLLEILMSKGVLGKMAMQNYIKNNYNLAEAVNSAVTLGQANIPLINRKQEDKNINDVLLNPSQYAIGAPGGASNLMGRVASVVTSPKQLPENAKAFKESIFAIARAIPGYVSDKGFTNGNEEAIKKLVRDIQADAASSTSAKLIIQQLEAMSNHLPGKKDYIGVISGAAQIAKGLSLGVPTMGR